MVRVLFTLLNNSEHLSIKGNDASVFLGAPIVCYTLAAIELAMEQTPEFDASIAICTNSDNSINIMDSIGINCFNVKPPVELTGDEVSKVLALRHAMHQAEGELGHSFDYVVNLDSTSPLRSADDVIRVLKKRITSSADVIFAVTSIRGNPLLNIIRFTEEGKYLPIMKSRSCEMSSFYAIDGSICAYTTSFLESGKRLFDGTCDAVAIENKIENPLEDEEYIEFLAQRLLKTHSGFREIHNRATTYAVANNNFNAINTCCKLSPSWVNKQIEALFGKCDISPYFARAKQRALYCFTHINNKYFHKGIIDPLHIGQYALFLCYLAREAYEASDSETAGKIYYLNKTLHGFDIYYEVEIPDVFFMEHPVGTVLGRAKYSDRLFVGQNVTVGGNRGKYPIIGKNVMLHAGCIIVGNTVIGDNVEVSAGTFIRDERVPDNCLVFGESPNLVIKVRDANEMHKRLYVFRDSELL